MRNLQQSCPRCDNELSPSATECPRCGLGLKFLASDIGISGRFIQNW